MRLDELYNYYGTWYALARALNVGVNTHQYWRKIGYIPYPTQLVIEKRTKGLFKASEEDAKRLEDDKE